MKMLNQLIRWSPSILWMAVIFYLSSRTGDELGTLIPLFQIIFPAMQSFDWGHFVAYFILACTYYWAALPKYHGIYTKLAVVILCGLYGVTDEFHQSFVGGRQPDPLDIRNDVIGAALAMLFVSIPVVRRFIHRIRGSSQ